MFKRKYPSTRLRRLRKNSNLIDLISETNISSNDLIQPIFIKENFKGTEEINSMPGIFRYGVDQALIEVENTLNSETDLLSNPSLNKEIVSHIKQKTKHTSLMFACFS